MSGWSLVAASRLFGDSLPERVVGSDLVPELFRSASVANKRRTVFLLGAAPGVGDVVASNITSQFPWVDVVGAYSPPLGFEHDAAECQRIIERVNRLSPDLLIVGFGAPKQEQWLRRFHQDLFAGVAIAAGATIDFFAGQQIRAPIWMQKTRLEWSHRLLTNPRRLAGRYAKNAVELPRLMFGEYAMRARGGGHERYGM